jgi:hypothetical protein
MTLCDVRTGAVRIGDMAAPLTMKCSMTTERSCTMGDKGGKKDKHKHEKQKVVKHEQKEKHKHDKQPKSLLMRPPV